MIQVIGMVDIAKIVESFLSDCMFANDYNMKWLGFGATNLSHATKLTSSKLANKPTNTQLFILCVSGSYL